MPSASRHTRTVPSSPPLMMTGVPSGSTPAATALTAPSGRSAARRPGCRRPVRHTRTVPSSPPLMMTGVLSGSTPAATAPTVGVAGQRLANRSAVSGPPHPHRAVLAAADDDRGAVRQRPGRHRLTPPPWPVSGSPTGVPSASPPHPHRAVPAAADDDRGAVRHRPGRHRGHAAVVAGQRLADRGAVGESATPAPCRPSRR